LRPFPAPTPQQVQTTKERCGPGCGTSFFPEKKAATISQSRGEARRTVSLHVTGVLEFPLSISPRAAAKILKAEGWYSPKTTIYHIEDRVRRCVERAIPKTSGRKTRIVQPCLGRSETAGIRSLVPGLVSVGSPLRILLLGCRLELPNERLEPFPSSTTTHAAVIL